MLEQAVEGSPLPATIGPYRILGVLGEGGMGVVYRAEHLDTGEPAAIKTVLAPVGSSLASIRREIHALDRLCHPGIVRIVAHGVSQGIPWYGMELLTGRTLRDHVRDLWAQPAIALAATALQEGETLTAAALSDTESFPETAPREMETLTAAALHEQPTHRRDRAAGEDAAPRPPPARRCTPPLGPTLALFQKLCATLAFLHGAGVVHRDLKPENVFVKNDGTPVLVDLGIAARFGGAEGREALDVDGLLAGTASYMAPEQIRGEFVDARADLYALGCMLYESATGALPFTGSLREVLHAQLFVSPRSPSSHVGGLPAGLDDLIRRLLKKSPRDRIGYAQDVARALGAPGAVPAGWPAPAPYIYRPDFVGREAALETLQAAATRARAARRGGLVFVSGESGVGKTRLVMEVARSAAQGEMTVVTGQCAALGLAGAGPLHPFRPLLCAVADWCRERGPRRTRGLLGPWGKVLAAYEPALADLHGEDELHAPAPLPPEAARARVLAALKATLLAFAEVSPLLLVLDDLQWADDLTLSFLRSLGPGDVEAHPVLIAGTYRIEELGEALEAVVRAPGAVALDLGRLDIASVRAMVCGMLALDVPPAGLLQFLARRADGNPFFVAEYLRAAIGEGLLNRNEAGAWQLRVEGAASDVFEAAVPLPTALADLIDRRLQSLGAEGRALVDAAAILGREFDGDLLAEADDMDGAAAADALGPLCARQVLEEAKGGRLRFVHDKIREIAHERIPAERRRALHRRAAEAIERRSPDEADAFAALAHHWAEAGIHDRASFYFERAADGARAAYANRDAIAFYRAALAEAAAIEGQAEAKAPARLAGVNERLGDVLVLAGLQDEARGAFEEALRQAAPDARVLRARLHRKCGKARETHHMHVDALRAYADAEAALGQAPGEDGDAFWHERVQIQIERISVSYWLAQVDRLAALIDEVRPLIEARGAPLQRARFFEALVQRDFLETRYRPSDGTVALARASVAACEASGDESAVAEGECMLGTVLLLRGPLDEAERRLRAALSAAGRIGDTTLRSRCLAYLTWHARVRGRVEGARYLAAQSLEAAEAAGMTNYVGFAAANQAWLALRGGDLAATAQHGAAALACWQRIPLVFPFHWLARLPLAAAALAEGRLSEAAEHARAALEPAQQRLPEALEAAILAALEAWEKGDVERARGALEEAMVPARRLGYA